MVCNRCKADVATDGLEPGALVSCPSCGGLMGRVKAPTIKVNINISAPERPKTTRSAPRGGTSRQIERPRIASKPNYTNYIIWGVLLIGVAIGAYYVIKMPPSQPVAKKNSAKPKEPEPQPLPISPAPPPKPPEEAKGEPPKVEEKQKIKTVKYRGKEYTVPSEFMAGAANCTKKFPLAQVTQAEIDKISVVLEKGDVASLLKEPWNTYLPVVANSLSDEEKVATSAFDYLHKISIKYKLPGLIEGEPFNLAVEFFTDPNARGAAFEQFLEFDSTLRKYWEKEKMGFDPLSKEDLNWDKMIVDLGGYQLTMEKGSETKYTYEDSEDSLGKKTFERVKKMGKVAYPYLVKFILDEDPQRMKTAIVVLNMLTGYPARIPRPTDKEKAYREWLDNLGLSEDKIPK